MILKAEKLHSVAAEDHSEHDFVNAPVASLLRPAHSRGRLSRYGEAAVDVNNKGRLLRVSRSAQYTGMAVNRASLADVSAQRGEMHIKALFCSSDSFFYPSFLRRST